MMLAAGAACMAAGVVLAGLGFEVRPRSAKASEWLPTVMFMVGALVILATR